MPAAGRRLHRGERQVKIHPSPRFVGVLTISAVMVAALGSGMFSAAPAGAITGATPSGVTLSAAPLAATSVYVADTNNNRIVKLAPDGTQSTVATTGLNQPRGIAVTSQ